MHAHRFFTRTAEPPTMSSTSKLLLALLIVPFVLPSDPSMGQSGSLRRNARQIAIDAQIGNQQVQRQSEVSRLERMLREFESRMIRVERQMMSLSRLPTITIAEAKAGLEFAQAQLRESEKLHKEGKINDVALAADRLALARARGQLDTAESAHAESLVRAEMDVLYAERELLTQTNENSQLERLVAKGYATSNSLAYRKLDVSLAEKQLQRARILLEAQKKSSDQAEDSELVEDSKQGE